MGIERRVGGEIGCFDVAKAFGEVRVGGVLKQESGESIYGACPVWILTLVEKYNSSFRVS